MTENKKDDLGVVIEDEEIAAWKSIKKAAEADMKNARRSILVNDQILKLAKKMISEEKQKV